MSLNYSLPAILSLKAPVDQTYLQQIKKLEHEVKAIKNAHQNAFHKSVYLLLIKFAENYMMPFEYWNELFDTIWRNSFDLDKNYVRNLSQYQFYDNANIRGATASLDFSQQKIMSNPRRKFLTIYNKENEQKSFDKKNFTSLIQILHYPNCDIEQAWTLYESEICTFPSKSIVETYQKMRNLYFKINLIDEKNVSEWFNALLEVEDDEFVIDNVEYRLGKDFTNKLLWKLYIKFWEKRDKMAMLHVYSKYCRIFVGQKSIKNEYEKEVKKLGKSVNVPWKNAFPFEKYDENFDFNSAIKQRQKIRPQKQKHVKPCDRYFNPDNALIKKLPFQHTFIKHIFEIFNFSVTDPTALSAFIPKILKCNAKFVDLKCQNLTLDEIKVIIGHGNVEEILLHKVTVFDKINQRNIPIEEILRLTPKLKKLT
uniref:Uncharacterized protein n=1 Tax=Panagrolaimus sp. ES5 TaxID=591445 RepID=A0AC34FTL6_9BILA